MFCQCTSLEKEQKVNQNIAALTATGVTPNGLTPSGLTPAFRQPPAFSQGLDGSPEAQIATPQAILGNTSKASNASAPSSPTTVEDTVNHLKSTFNQDDLARIIDMINESHPQVCKQALVRVVKEEVSIFMLAIRSQVEAQLADQIEGIMNDLSNDPALQEKLRSDYHQGRQVAPLLRGASADMETEEAEDVATRNRASTAGGVPIFIQFGSTVYYADEEIGFAEVDVMRIGDSSGTSFVNYSTGDASAVAGTKYVAISGQLEFKPGEILKTLKVKIVPDDHWDATLEFKLLLTEPKNAHLDDFHSKARIKILDDDAFPTNKYKDKFAEEGLSKLPKFRLLIEYFKLCFLDPKIRRASLVTIFFDQISNLHLIFFLFVKLYLIDYILDEEATTPNKSTLLIGVGGLVIIPQSLTSLAMIERVGLRVGGMCRLKLQANLLRKFLNYDECLRASVGLSDLMLSITHHSPELVQDGYLQALKFIQEVGKMLLLVGYQCVLSARQGSIAASASGALPIIIFPVLMIGFLVIRHEKTDRLRLDMMMKEKAMASHVEVIAYNARMIIDYQQRSSSMDAVEKSIRQLNDAINGSHGNHTVNMQFAPWLAGIVIGIYIVVAGQLVLSRDLTLGAFIVTIDMYQRISTSWQDVYEVILTMHNSLPALELVFWHMNLPIDLKQRCEYHMNCCRVGAEERVKARQKDKDKGVVYSIDMLPIKMTNVGYTYPEYDTSGLKHTSQMAQESRGSGIQGSADIAGVEGINLEIRQGTLAALVGKRGQGKTTLLKILGGVLVPTGDFYMPTHLRVVHVSQQPMFFSSTLLMNLRYGILAGSEDGNINRVKEICKTMNVSEEVMNLIVDEGEHKWDSTLSLTQRMSLHLARALISNPDVLIIHKPTLVFDEKMAASVVQTFKKFVKMRGLALEADMSMRRRRTCIITLSKLEGCQYADQLLLVQKHGVSEISIKQMDESMIAG